MTLLYIAPIKSKIYNILHIDLPRILEEIYPHLFNDAYVKKTKVVVHKAYFSEGKEIMEPYSEAELNLGSYYDDLQKKYIHYVDVTDILKDKGIGINYILELYLYSFVRKEPGKKQTEIPIFPGELLIEVDPGVPYNLRNRVEAEKKLYEEISNEIDAIALLENTGLKNSSIDLREALLNYKKQEWEASINEFRKVIEALRPKIDNKEVNFGIEKRWEIMKAVIHNTYSLLSNFGQHAGTQGGKPEAKLAKELTTALVHYITQYMTTLKTK